MVDDKNVAKKWQTCARAKLVPGIFRRNWITSPVQAIISGFQHLSFLLQRCRVQTKDRHIAVMILSLLSLRWYCWQCWRGHICFNSMNCLLQALVVQALVLPIFCLSALPWLSIMPTLAPKKWSIEILDFVNAYDTLAHVYIPHRLYCQNCHVFFSHQAHNYMLEALGEIFA